jgi:hypothetical protein
VIRSSLCLSFAFLGLGILPAFAASPAIGVVSADGAFSVNQSRVNGNATLFEGATVETGQASSRLQLNNGAHLELGGYSRVRISGSEAILEKGSGQFGGAAGFRLTARTLHIRAAAPSAVVRVRLQGAHEILVAAVEGPVRIFNRNGTLVARMEAGMALAFDPSAGSPDAFDASGCLLSRNGALALATDTQLFQVQGIASQSLIGNRVHITGSTAGGPVTWPGATGLVTLSSVTLTERGGCTALAAKYGAAPPAPAGAPAVKASHTTAIVAGVAIAGAGGGIAAWAATRGGGNNASR